MRTTVLPNVLEPTSYGGGLSYDDPDNVASYLPIKSFPDSCPSGSENINVVDPNGCRVARETCKNTRDLGGYTSFAGPELLVVKPDIRKWCRDDRDETIPLLNRAMVSSSNCFCPESETTFEGFTGKIRCILLYAHIMCTLIRRPNTPLHPYFLIEITLQVAANSSPNCRFHTKNGGPCSNKLCVSCKFNDGTFKRSDPFLNAGPEGLGLYRGDDKTGIDYVRWMRHYTLGSNARTFFALDIDDPCAAQDFPQYNACSAADPLNATALAARQATRDAALTELNRIFNNQGNPDPLPIEFRFATEVPDSPPSDYPTQAPLISSFTYVYGKDEWSQVGGRGRRRTGTSNRDYTVMTLNWLGGSRVEPGQTYVNKQFFFSSTLGDVDAKANTLLPEVEIAKITSNEYQPRRVDLYQLGTSFTAIAAPSSEGDATVCQSSSASLVCSGKTTPTSGYLAYFYVSCGTSSYFGSDPFRKVRVVSLCCVLWCIQY